MNKYPILIISIICLFWNSLVKAQKQDTISKSQWNHAIVASLYIWETHNYILPVYSIDKDWLHMEARYNYENMNTFSAWFGYTISGGKNFQYSFIPMFGGVIGNSMGIAPGLELTLAFKGFQLYSELEYLFEFRSKEEDFFYQWTDFTYSPANWIWFGLSAQRTKHYQTDRKFQRGMLLGGGYKWFGLSGYLYDLSTDDPFIIVSLIVNLPY